MASALDPVPAEEPIALGIVGDLIGYRLRRAYAVVADDFQRALADTGMRQVLYAILSVVAANPGVNQGNVGRVLGIQRANMVSLINELVDAGLIDRRVAAADRRAFALSLTPPGETLLADCTRRIDRHEERLLAGLAPAERDTLASLLRRVAAQGR